MVFLIVVLFVALGSLWISLPGLQYDETLFVLASWPRDDTPIAYTMHFGERPVALMIISYLGALKGWLWGPILAAWGGSAAAVRIPALMLGAAGLWFLYLFCRRALSWQAALFALALAATDPIYLFTTRLDWGPVAIQRLCLMAGCFGVLRGAQESRARDMALGCFALGVGVFDKATFLCLLAALALSAAIVYPGEAWRAVRSRMAAAGVAGLVVGAAPFLYYNWKWQGETFRQQAERADNYGEKLRGLQRTLEGTALAGWISRDLEGEPLPPPGALARAAYAIAPRAPEAATLLLPAATMALLVLPALPFTPWGRFMMFAALFGLLAVAQMLPVRNAGAAHHLALLLPFPQIFAAAGLAGARETVGKWLTRLRRRQFADGLLWLVALVLVATNVRVVAHHYYRLLAYGGSTGWSEAIYELEQSLARRPADKIVLLDWGMDTQLRLLSNDRLPLLEATQPEEADYDARYLEPYIRNPRVVWVKHASGERAAFPQIVRAFEARLEQLKYHSEIVETVKDRWARPVYEILAVRPGSAADSRPSPTR